MAPRSTSLVEEAVARVALWRGAEIRVSQLSGGLTNENYLVETAEKRYVVRIPGRATDLLAIDRKNELFNTRAAASTGIGPAVLEHVAELDVMVLEFIPGPTMSAQRLQSEPMARRMAESFKRLHAAPRFLHNFNMFRLIEYYLRIVDQHGVTIPSDYRDRLPAIGRVERAVAVGALPSVSCHNDLLCENFIDDGSWLRIVDYELSGNNDPCFDLGNTAQEANFDEHLRDVLCQAYFGRLDQQQLARMNLFALMSDVGWTLWGAIQAKISALDFDFVDYYTTRWSRAVAVMESAPFEAWLRQAVDFGVDQKEEGFR
jgi:thiamine kinase-like enzyme